MASPNSARGTTITVTQIPVETYPDTRLTYTDPEQVPTQTHENDVMYYAHNPEEFYAEVDTLKTSLGEVIVEQTKVHDDSLDVIDNAIYDLQNEQKRVSDEVKKNKDEKNLEVKEAVKQFTLEVKSKTFSEISEIHSNEAGQINRITDTSSDRRKVITEVQKCVAATLAELKIDSLEIAGIVTMHETFKLSRNVTDALSLTVTKTIANIEDFSTSSNEDKTPATTPQTENGENIDIGRSTQLELSYIDSTVSPSYLLKKARIIAHSVFVSAEVGCVGVDGRASRQAVDDRRRFEVACRIPEMRRFWELNDRYLLNKLYEPHEIKEYIDTFKVVLENRMQIIEGISAQMTTKELHDLSKVGADSTNQITIVKKDAEDQIVKFYREAREGVAAFIKQIDGDYEAYTQQVSFRVGALKWRKAIFEGEMKGTIKTASDLTESLCQSETTVKHANKVFNETEKEIENLKKLSSDLQKRTLLANTALRDAITGSSMDKTEISRIAFESMNQSLEVEAKLREIIDRRNFHVDQNFKAIHKFVMAQAAAGIVSVKRMPEDEKNNQSLLIQRSIERQMADIAEINRGRNVGLMAMLGNPDTTQLTERLRGGVIGVRAKVRTWFSGVFEQFMHANNHAGSNRQGGMLAITTGPVVQTTGPARTIDEILYGGDVDNNSGNN